MTSEPYHEYKYCNLIKRMYQIKTATKQLNQKDNYIYVQV